MSWQTCDCFAQIVMRKRQHIEGKTNENNGATGRNRTGTTYVVRFSYHFGFRRHNVRGLDYTLTIAFALGPRRLVSTRSKVFLLRLRSVLAF